MRGRSRLVTSSIISYTRTCLILETPTTSSFFNEIGPFSLFLKITNHCSHFCGFLFRLCQIIIIYNHTMRIKSKVKSKMKLYGINERSIPVLFFNTLKVLLTLISVLSAAVFMCLLLSCNLKDIKICSIDQARVAFNSSSFIQFQPQVPSSVNQNLLLIFCY